MLTTTVYVMGVPENADVCPSVLVIDRSAGTISVVVSVALLLLVFGSLPLLTVAVLVRMPVALEAIVPLTVYVIVLPAPMLTVSLMFPEPDGVLPLTTPVVLLV